jgi:hypothetical protein
MNKRIKALIAQATTRKQYSGPFGVQQVDEHFDKEKFAELIVRECVDLFPLTSRPLSGGAIQSMIKEHFGVEE